MKLESTKRIRSASLGLFTIVNYYIYSQMYLEGRTRDHERRYRYWTFLFDHLNRIIDEIYQNCEADESIDQCDEAILALQNHIVDFQALIEWLKLNKNLETTPQRPNSVSWEVRKRLPKNPIWQYYMDLDSHKNISPPLCDNKCNIRKDEVSTIMNGSKNLVKPNTLSIQQNLKSVLNSEKPLNGKPHLQENHLTNGKPEHKKFQCDKKIKSIATSHKNGYANKPQVAFDLSPDKNSLLNRCNSFNTITRSSKYDLDEDGFQVVRYKQRNKVTQLKIINNAKEIDIKTVVDRDEVSLPGGDNSMGDHKTPCRALQLHEKFSSPSRKRSFNDTLKKQAKAQEAREKLLEVKAGKFKGIVKKVEEIKAQKEEQQLQLKLSMEMRLQRADEKREENLRNIVRKAHDEDSKVNEILFINSLEADSKKHEIFSKEKVYELRLQDLHEERQRKLEEKASKEAAFEKRKKAIEAEKQARIEQLKEQRKLKVLKIQQQLAEKEKERLELAFQKELDRKSKLSALNALHAAEKEELQKKILVKQEESKRRHEENMEQIRQKALEFSVRKSSSLSDDALVCVPYDTVKMCALCKVIIKSEVYLFGHLRGKKHNDAIKEQNEGKIPSVEELESYNLKNIIDAPLHTDTSLTDLKPFLDCDSEKLKQAKKKSKKLRQKIVSRTNQFEDKCALKSPNSFTIPKEVKFKFSKITKELMMLNSNDRITGQWPVNMIRNLERTLNDLEKLCIANELNTEYFHSINGMSLLTRILSRILNGTTERPTSLTDSANNKLTSFYKLICTQNLEICHYFFQSNNIISMLDILYHRINLCINANTNSGFPYDSLVGTLCEFFSAIFERIFEHYSCSMKENEFDSIILHIKDIINYLVIIGVIDKLSIILSSIRDSVNEMPQQALFVKQIILLLSSISKLMTLFVKSDDITYGIKLTEDETQFMLTLRVNQLCGIVSLLYGLLLHSGTPVRNENIPILVPAHTLEAALEAIRFFNNIALLDINLIQSILGGEGLSLQIRHICSYLIWYCSHYSSNSGLLHEVILLIGNFVVLNMENQTLLQLGQRPTVVQQLCSLPFEYFSEASLSQILFPSLIVCCFKNDDNMTILKQEMSTSMLSSYIEETIVNAQLEQLNSTEKTNRKNSLVSEKWSLGIRFPKNKWNEAKFYFE